MYKHYYKLLVVFLVFQVLTFCQSESDFINVYMQNYSDIAERKVLFSEKMYVYNKIKIDKSTFEDGNIIICLGYLDCSPCILRLKEIESFKRSYPSIKIVYIAAGNDSEYSRYQIENSNFSFPIYHDLEASFLITNHFEKYDKSVFLLNENNEVVLVGSPFNNKILLKYYLKMLIK